MLSAEQNELVTQTGPGTPAGDLHRRYWQPACLAEELEGERAVVPVRLLGENLVAFRDDQGRCGLIGRQCPHRGVDLCYGRLEDGGLRCPFHGWLFDVTGACLEQPAEPADSTFHRKIRHTGYPCHVRNGIVFAYMGPGEPPPFPEYDCFVAPATHTFAFKGHIDCNWLQALEVGIDPAHASFLHRFFDDEDPVDGYGKQFRDTSIGTDTPMTTILRNYPRPEIEVEETPHGLRLTALRRLNDAHMHVRITNLAFPHAIVIPLSTDMVLTQWHVPIDDYQCYWYSIFASFTDAVDKEEMRAQRLQLYTLPDYKPRLNRSNDWGFSASEQRDSTYTGMGDDINVHDNWAVESPGPIFDRTKEHLGTTDRAITTNRRMLLRAISGLKHGERPPALPDAGNASNLRGPVAIDTIAPSDDWDAAWKVRDMERREASPWASDPW